ncbi:MAG: hypothetical protein OCD02_14690 [Spirochaetaceae bacterium]
MNKRKVKWKADFNYLLKVLKQEKTDRPVLFEFYMNDDVYDKLTEGMEIPPGSEDFQRRFKMINAFNNAGYDYATLMSPAEFTFVVHDQKESKSYSLNDGSDIVDRESFENFKWPEVKDIDWSFIEDIMPYIPNGMKLVASGPGGVEENVIALVGFENLSYMMIDEPGLVKDLFDAVGIRLVEYYKKICEFEVVGACISNDDWGFNTQTFLSPSQMEDWLFPWHQKITDVIHDSGRPVVLHSCGNIYPIMDVVINDLKYEGKHSYEDAIMPVEDAWEKYQGRISIMGGIDVDFIIRSSKEAVYNRCYEMLERTAAKGSYALGTGNSVPKYLPMDKYFTLLQAFYDWGNKNS